MIWSNFSFDERMVALGVCIINMKKIMPVTTNDFSEGLKVLNG